MKILHVVSTCKQVKEIQVHFFVLFPLVTHVWYPKRIWESCSYILHNTFRHSFAHSVNSVAKFYFARKIYWVLPETTIFECLPICFIVFSPPYVVLHMGCTEAKMVSTVGSHAWSLATVKAHCSINRLTFV